MDDPELQRLSARFVQGGRRLLMWPRGAPTAVVQGQLGWLNIQFLCLLRVAGLWARLLCSPQRSVAARIAHIASTNSHSSISHMGATLVNIGVAPPPSWGIGPCTPISVVHSWLRHVKEVVCRYSHAAYHAALLATESLSSFAQWQPLPNLPAIVDCRHVLSVFAWYWGLARCGHHCFGDGRSARHRGDAPRPCRFCAHESAPLHHALLERNAHRILRERWQDRTA